MPKSVSCRRCGKPNKLSLCVDCRTATYGSPEYQNNSKLIRTEVQRRRHQGIPVRCVICDQIMLGAITIEHIRSLIDGGSNNLNNLGPAHIKCNLGQHKRQ